MLMLMLVAAVTMGLRPLVTAQPLCRWGCPPGAGVLPGVRRVLVHLGAEASSPTSLRLPFYSF